MYEDFDYILHLLLHLKVFFRAHEPNSLIGQVFQ